ncbi:MAG: RNA degradosome polyphosphate kinase [Defluviitaleaceae bacterium]|nr:RNA degradosome polyphosphate kinase [Defluviitaleaceae bacterium]
MNLLDASLYNNRELSWLEFNERVLEEAIDKTNPLMERLKFLAITASNLDEFFMVRVASLVRVSTIMHNESDRPDASGLTPHEQLSAVLQRVREMVAKQYSCLMRSIFPSMEKEGIVFLNYNGLDEKQKKFCDDYFNDVLYQVLTPMAIDQSRPFPAINNRTVNIFIELAPDKDAPITHGIKWSDDASQLEVTEEQETGRKYAFVQVPTVVPRIVRLPRSQKDSRHDFILLENIIMAHIDKLFHGHTVSRTALIRVTRNMDIDISEEDIEDLLDEMARSLRGRRWGEPVRIEKSKKIGKHAAQLLQAAIDISDEHVYEISGPPDLAEFFAFASQPEFAHLRHSPIKPTPVAAFENAPSMFRILRKQDVLVHHPYASFDPVLRFVQEAAADPRVLAIKQTLYRVSGKSPIIHALIKAAENGKQVSVLVELKARFDEENNIHWAKLMEKSGIHVIYGLTGLKTHCKVCLVIRREDDAIRRYMHLSTGNYNESTAKIYTDIGLFTCNESFGQDATQLFNLLTGYSKMTEWKKFFVAPATLRSELARLIDTEAKNAARGKPAEITAKMNSLTDIDMIRLLYLASQAGVKIRLLVRGICCLRPGVPGVSENITVSSIIDRYLEHSRIFIFENNGKKRVYLSSADLMERNLNRRVEVMFPVDDEKLKQEIIDSVKMSLSDNVKRRTAAPDGTYARVSRRGQTMHSQLEHHRITSEKFRLVFLSQTDTI